MDGREGAPVALITGGGTGIGAATARRLAAAGYRVAVNGRRPEPLAAVAAEVGGLALPADAADEDGAAGIVADAVRTFGRLDAVVLNAGGGHSGNVLEQTPESFRGVLRGNVEGPFLVARAALPHLLERGGAIVTVASLAGLRVGPDSAAYCTAKAAAIMLAQTMAIDFGPRGVRSNAVCPGWVRTDIGDRGMDWLAQERGIDREAAYALATGDVPLRRAATADEVAEAIAWLVSPASSYVNGASLLLDGGVSLVDAATLAFRS